jgi:hypothetical protein
LKSTKEEESEAEKSHSNCCERSLNQSVDRRRDGDGEGEGGEGVEGKKRTWIGDVTNDYKTEAWTE